MLPISDLRAYLAGSWQFTRRITHDRSRQVASIDGTGTWSSVPRATPGLQGQATYLYQEQGVLQFHHYTGNATQAYHYRFVETARAEIYFRDGRFFYTLDLSTGECDMQHPCGKDLYDGRVEVMSETRFQHIWQVRGPHKHYTSETTFFRLLNRRER